MDGEREGGERGKNVFLSLQTLSRAKINMAQSYWSTLLLATDRDLTSDVLYNSSLR